MRGITVPYKDIEKRRAAARRGTDIYRKKNKDKLSKKEKERRKNDPEWAEERREKVRKYYAARPDYRRKQKRKFAENNPASVIATRRKTKLGISREEQEAIFASQNGLCAICECEIDFVKGHLDHCHETMKVRGFLCRWCNHIIGNAKDDPAKLSRAIEYLEQHALSK